QGRPLDRGGACGTACRGVAALVPVHRPGRGDDAPDECGVAAAVDARARRAAAPRGRLQRSRHRPSALHERVDGEVPHRPDLPEAPGSEPRPGTGHRYADRTAFQRAAPRGIAHIRTRIAGLFRISSQCGPPMVRKDYSARIESGIRREARVDMIGSGGLRPSALRSPAINTLFCRRKQMLDYLRIMLNARLAKMDERGASAVDYGLLIGRSHA